jgi:hypothetical protein
MTTRPNGWTPSIASYRTHVDLRVAAVRLGVSLQWDATPTGLAPGHSRVLLDGDEGLVNTDDAATIAQAEAIAQAFPWRSIVIQVGLS